MSVSSVGSTSSLWGAFGASPLTPPALTNTAQLLGMSANDLQMAMQSGTTLSQLAQQNGISQKDLISAISSDLQANAPAGAPQLSQSQLTQMATNIAQGKHPHHHHHGFDSNGNNGSSTNGAAGFEALASALGMQGNDLLSALESGSSLSDIATQQGTSLQSVLAALQDSGSSLLNTMA